MKIVNKVLAWDFEIKDLGRFRYFLGMEIAKSKRGIIVSQRKYILDILQDMGMLGCKLTETLTESNLKFEKVSKETPIKKVGTKDQLEN